MPSTPLRELITDMVDQQWDAFAERHPHLAASIDRMHLVESTVQRIEADAAYQQAVADADVDEAALAAALRIVRLVERWLRVATPA